MTFPTHFSILAQAAPSAAPTGQGGGNLLGNPVAMFAILIVMFFFLVIRPGQRQRKEQAARIASLASGAKVISAGGIHGLVHNVKDTTVIVKVAEGVMLEFEKSSITAVVAKKDDAGKKTDAKKDDGAAS
jgi:preprotein translocase subunit YajC